MKKLLLLIKRIVPLLYRSKAVLRFVIVEYRSAIRYHRDQKGNDRCWLDDQRVYRDVLGVEPVPLEKIPFDKASGYCDQYDRKRRTYSKPPAGQKMPLDPDSDLAYKGWSALVEETTAILREVIRHYVIGDGKRRASDDSRLYEVLPEKILADQTLPPPDEFVCGPDGCLAYLRRHSLKGT